MTVKDAVDMNSLNSDQGFILKNKEFFDKKLIRLLESKDNKIKKLNDSLYKRNLLHELTKEENLKLKADLKKSNENLKTLSKKYKDQEDEIEKFRRELEELKRRSDEKDRLIEKLKDEIDNSNRIKDEIIKDLNIKIKKLSSNNSTNSNMPSSFDINSHSKPVHISNSRKKSTRSKGGQTGHKAHISKLSDNPDKIINITVAKAPYGALPVKSDEGNILYYRTQEVDLNITTEVTETRYYIASEATFCLNKDVMDKYAINPLSYSDRFKASVCYLNNVGNIPLDRLSKMVNELSNNEVSIKPSTIVKWNKELSSKALKFNEENLNNILNNHLMFVDETGVKINGKNYWFHVLTNNSGTYFIVSDKRGGEESEVVKLLDGYTGYLHHDHFKSYYRIKSCKHAECAAHVERHLQSGYDFEGNETCTKLIKLLNKMLKRKHDLIDLGINSASEEEYKKYESEYVKLLSKELNKYEKENKDRKIKSDYEPGYIKLFRRMLEYKDEHLLFFKEFDVEFTNNAAERQCRFLKGKKNVSRQFVTLEAALAYCTIASLIQTARPKGENILATFENIFKEPIQEALSL